MLRRIADEIADIAVVSLAFWTLLYCLGLTTQWSLWPSGWLWLIFTIGLLAWRGRAVLRLAPDPTAKAGDAAADEPSAPASRIVQICVAVGVVAAAGSALGGLIWTPGTFRLTWLATAVAIVALLAASYLSGRLGQTGDYEPSVGRLAGVTRYEDLAVLGVLAACAVTSLFIHLLDSDDPYYVNRSVWVAEHGNAALRDTMFSPEVYNSPYGGGIPIASIESLFGVIAHMTGLRAGTVTYLVGPPVGTALAVWAIWRLARRWAPRRAIVVFGGAIAFLMLSGDSMLGNFWIPRIWQGKVMAVTFLMPLIWAYLTDVYEARDRDSRLRAMVLLLASGIAFFGLTPTAVVWGPLMFGAVLLAAVGLRSKALAIGGALMVTGPILSGAAVVLFSSDVGGKAPRTLSAQGSFVRILGETKPMVALGLAALALAPMLTRRGAAAALAGAASLVSVWVFAPGILPLVNAVTGSGPILWRMLYVAPIPVLVGLLLAVPWTAPAGTSTTERRTRAVAAGAVVVVLAALAVGGRPVWSHTGHGGPVTVSSSPEWKLDTDALSDVRLLVEHHPHGVVLLPPARMQVLSMYTTDAFPVVPRLWFIGNILEPKADLNARHVLFDLASPHRPLPTDPLIRQALKHIDVSLACIGKSTDKSGALASLAAAGYRNRERIGTLTCLSRPPG
jgi:hypothetical protein